MKLTVLVDNNTFIDQYYLGEPGFCCLLEDGEDTVLFDTGYSEVFLKNADKLGLDLQKLTAIVLSHGHDDHTGGLPYYLDRFGNRARIIAHPMALEEKYTGYGASIGLTMDPALLREQAELTLTREPLWITDRLVFLGEIPEQVPFEPRVPIGVTGGGPDLLWDDTALAYVTGDGLYLITGCSHSGICSIAEHARKVCGRDRILGILGGLHLLEPSERTRRTADYLAGLNLRELYACHCTSLSVKAGMLPRLPLNEVGVGLTLRW